MSFRGGIEIALRSSFNGRIYIIACIVGGPIYKRERNAGSCETCMLMQYRTSSVIGNNWYRMRLNKASNTLVAYKVSVTLQKRTILRPSTYLYLRNLRFH